MDIGDRSRTVPSCLFFSRVPLRKHQSIRKKLRARGKLSDFWKSQNLDMIQFSESCKMDQSTNEPLINYLDVRLLRLKPRDTGCKEEGWASSRDQCCISDFGCLGMGLFAWMTQMSNPLVSVNFVKQAPVRPSVQGFLQEERDKDEMCSKGKDPTVCLAGYFTSYMFGQRKNLIPHIPSSLIPKNRGISVSPALFTMTF